MSNAVIFDASADSLRRTSGDLINYNAPYTVILPLLYRGSGDGVFRNVFVITDGNSAYDQFYVTSGHALRIFVNNNGSDTIALAQNAWYWLALIRSSVTVAKFYVADAGCNLVGQVSFTHSSMAGRVAMNRMEFGGNVWGEWISGSIGPQFIWQRELTENEIRSQFGRDEPVVDGAWAHYPVQPGVITRDLSGFGRHHTVGGTLTEEAGPPIVGASLPTKWLIPFAVAGGVDYDGAVTLAATATAAPTGQLSAVGGVALATAAATAGGAGLAAATQLAINMQAATQLAGLLSAVNTTTLAAALTAVNAGSRLVDASLLLQAIAATVQAGSIPALPKTYYFLDAAAGTSNHHDLQEGGTAPTAARITTGWIVSNSAPPLYARMARGVERAANQHTSTAQPNGAPDNTLGDCFRIPATLDGTFAAGNWAFSFEVQGETRTTSTHDGRLRIRMWRSANQDGSSATEITSSTQTTSAYANLANSAAQTVTLTFDPGSVTLGEEYLFVQVAHELTGAGNNVHCDTHLRVGSNNSIVTTAFTPRAGTDYDGTVTLGVNAASALLAILAGAGSATLATQVGTAQAGTLQAIAATLLQATAGLAQAGQLDTSAGATLAAQAGTAQAGTITVGDEMTLAVALAVILDGLRSIDGTLALDAEMGASQVGTLAALNQLLLDAIAEAAQTGALSVPASVTLATIAAAAQSGGLTVQGALTLAALLDLALALQGQTIEASLALAADAGISQAGALQAVAAALLDAAATIAQAGQLDASNALALLANAVTAQGGQVDAINTASIGVAVTVETAAQAPFTVNLSLPVNASLTPDGLLNTVASTLLSMLAAVAPAGTLTAANAVALGANAATAQAGQWTGDAGLALGLTVTVETSGVAPVVGSIELPVSTALAAAGVLDADGNLSLTALQALSGDSVLNAIGSAVLAKVMAVQLTAQLTGMTGITLATVQSVVSAGALSIIQALVLSATAGLTLADTVIDVVITTPDGRIYRVRIDGRIFSVDQDNRIFSVVRDDRTFFVR